MKKIKFILNSPYKWGPGWTGTHEEYTLFYANSTTLLISLGFEPEYTLFGNLIGKKEDGSEAFIHPMEFVFTIPEAEIEEISRKVKNWQGDNGEFYTVEKVIDITKYQ